MRQSDKENPIILRLKQMKLGLFLVSNTWHFFLFVLLLQMIAVTFREILRCIEERDAAPMIECLFDESRGTRWRGGTERKMKTEGQDGKIALRSLRLITSTVRRSGSDILAWDVSSIFWGFCWIANCQLSAGVRSGGGVAVLWALWVVRLSRVSCRLVVDLEKTHDQLPAAGVLWEHGAPELLLDHHLV